MKVLKHNVNTTAKYNKYIGIHSPNQHEVVNYKSAEVTLQMLLPQLLFAFAFSSGHTRDYQYLL